MPSDKNITNKDILFYGFVAGLFLLLKLFYVFASSSDVLFLLAPTNLLVEWFTGSQSFFTKDFGYFFHDLQIYLDKSCAGFHFWLLCSFLLLFLTKKHAPNNKQKLLFFFTSFALAYGVTLFVNSFRIVASLVLQNQALLVLKGFTKTNSLNQKFFQAMHHEAIGIVVSITFLTLVYLIGEKLFTLQKGMDHARHNKP